MQFMSGASILRTEKKQTNKYYVPGLKELNGIMTHRTGPYKISGCVIRLQANL